MLGQTGGLLSHNLFAYCFNNPIVLKDTSGFNSTEAIAGILEVAWTIALAEPTPFGEIVVGLATIITGAIIINNAPSISTSTSTSLSISSRINWDINDNDKNHILNNKRHDWGKFGIDPKDPGAWGKLLPLIKLAVDQCDTKKLQDLGSGISFIWTYTKYFKDIGETIIVKIWQSGITQQLTDAYPQY